MAIIRCSCNDPMQDKLNGNHNRVGNKTSDTPPKWRCTKCLKEVPESQVVRR